MKTINKKKVYVVIPNWNGADLLVECLDALLQQPIDPEQVIIVDNGSVDASRDILTRKYPQITTLLLDHNTGFAGGVNRGIEEALRRSADYVALLNNDALAAPGWLQSLVDTIEQLDKTGIVTSKILRLDKKHIDSTGDFLTIWGMPFPRGRNERDTGQYDSKLNIFAASGGASLYRRELFEDIGLFDEDFFAYFEDVDISFRAQLRGWQVRYCPSAQVYHHVNATSSKLGSFSYYHTVKNFMLLYAKNMPLSIYLKYGPLFCIQFMRLFLAGAKRKMPFVFVRGVYGAVKLHFKTAKKRRQIQKTRLVSARYIDSLLVHHRPPRPPEIKQAGEV